MNKEQIKKVADSLGNDAYNNLLGGWDDPWERIGMATAAEVLFILDESGASKMEIYEVLKNMMIDKYEELLTSPHH